MPPKNRVDETLSKQNLKASIWYTVSKIIEEEEPLLGVAASEHFVASLSEMVFLQALSMTKDLESFAKHAGRSTIGVEDVKLAARRNESLYDLLVSIAENSGLVLKEKKKEKAPPKPRATTTKKKAREPTPKSESESESEGSDENEDELQKIDRKLSAAMKRRQKEPPKKKKKVIEVSSEEE